MGSPHGDVELVDEDEIIEAPRRFRAKLGGDSGKGAVRLYHRSFRRAERTEVISAALCPAPVPQNLPWFAHRGIRLERFRGVHRRCFRDEDDVSGLTADCAACAVGRSLRPLQCNRTWRRCPTQPAVVRSAYSLLPLRVPWPPLQSLWPPLHSLWPAPAHPPPPPPPRVVGRSALPPTARSASVPTKHSRPSSVAEEGPERASEGNHESKK